MAQPVKENPPQIAPLSQALGSRYLSYALSTIMARSLPDVRDGLKPVQRRILYAMHQLKLDPASGYKKAARVVGDVIGKYHPHGDVAVYDAMVRLAQDFASRYPLVDGQGNFGNIDGDNPAAMRYTEAKMTDVAKALLEDLDKNTVDFDSNYDGTEEEPIVLPAYFPNLLANGATGIAVGMATSIPPHNVGEVCEALIHLIKHPNARTETLLEKMPGPDFPTGGFIVDNPDALFTAYDSGRGSLTLRAKWEVEDLGRGQYQVVVTEIPYMVPKGRIYAGIGDLIAAKKLPLVEDIVDESAEHVRLVIHPKNRTVDPALMMETVFKASDLQTNFTINLNVLDKNTVPQVMNLRQILQSFLDHRREVLQRKSSFRLDQITRRLEILNGYLIVYLNLDDVIHIIRSEDEPKPVLMKRFGLNDIQAEAILNMRLRSLRKLEEMELRQEKSKLETEEGELRALLENESLQWQEISRQIKTIKEKFTDKRRSGFIKAPDNIDLSVAEVIEKEPITVILSQAGWIRAAKGHSFDPETIKYKEGDGERFIIKAQTTDKILLFATDGRFFTLPCEKLPSARGFGEPVSLMVDLNKAEIARAFVYEAGAKLIVASSDGRGFMIQSDQVLAQTKNGKQILNVSSPSYATVVRKVTDGSDSIAVINSTRKLLVFPLNEVSELNRGKGITLQKIKGGTLTDVLTFKFSEGLQFMTGRGMYTLPPEEVKAFVAGRATQGKSAPRGFPSSNLFQ